MTEEDALQIINASNHCEFVVTRCLIFDKSHWQILGYMQAELIRKVGLGHIVAVSQPDNLS